jgi:tetratricopeptide (TPR) repeat protein
MKLYLRCAAMAMLALAAAWAQRSDAKGMTVRGEIVSSDANVGNLSVELVADGSGLSETVPVNLDGSFEFRSGSPGTHELRVIAPNGAVIHQEYVSITSSNQTLSIHLGDRSPAGAANRGGSTVSLQQLNHKVPAAAQKAYQKGEQAASKGNLEAACAHFEEAVKIDPEFADAYNDLGAAKAGMKQLPEAAAEFQKAIDLAPEHPLALPNLSIVLAKMKNYHDAGEVARRALRVAPGSGKIHYILAVSILADHGNLDDALVHLERAAAEVPSAHITAAEILAQRGRSPEAIRHLEDYLATAAPDDAKRPKVEARLAELRQ